MQQAAVFGGGNWVRDGEFWRVAREIGMLLAELEYTVVTGGYGGAMEAVSEGAVAAGGRTFAYLHPHASDPAPNPRVQQSEMRSDYLDRLSALSRIPIGIALPGSSGTLAEIAVAIALLQRFSHRLFALYHPYWFDRIMPLWGSVLSAEKCKNRICWFSRAGDLRSWLQSTSNLPAGTI